MIWRFIWQKVKDDCRDIQMLLLESSLRVAQFGGIEFWGDEMTTIDYGTKIVFTYFIAYKTPKITYSKGSLNDKIKFIQSVVLFLLYASQYQKKSVETKTILNHSPSTSMLTNIEDHWLTITWKSRPHKSWYPNEH